MDHKAWLRVFQRDLTVTLESTLPVRSEEVTTRTTIFLDGTQFFKTHIGDVLCPSRLMRDLIATMRHAAKKSLANEIHVFFDTDRTSPTPGIEPAIDAKLIQGLGATSPHELKELASTLHGPRASTEWPKCLQNKEHRSILWRLPLFEWQLYRHANEEVQEYCKLTNKSNRFPDHVELVTLTGVPMVPTEPTRGHTTWERSWTIQENATRNQNMSLFDALPPHGHYFREYALTALTILDLGYACRGQYKYARAGHEPEVDSYLRVHDVYAHISRTIYKEAQASRAWKSRRWLVHHARGEAMWWLLLLVHRLVQAQLVEYPNDIQLFVQFDGETQWLAVGPLYQALRDWIEFHSQGKPFALDVFLLGMLAQTNRRCGVGEHEANPVATWNAYTQSSTTSGFRHLVSIHSRSPSRSPPTAQIALGDSGALPPPTDPPYFMRWCETLIDTERFAKLGQLVGQRVVWQLLETAGAVAGHVDANQTDFTPFPDLVIQAAYWQHRRHLPLAWQTHAPSTFAECMARVRRAHWFYEYARRVFSISQADEAIQHRFDPAVSPHQGPTCAWGWTSEAITDLTRTHEWFFDARLRVDYTSVPVSSSSLKTRTTTHYSLLSQCQTLPTSCTFIV
jgi:hypothetical protein